MEEVGEVAEAVLEEEWDELQAEISDVIVFACKLATIAEDNHKTDKLQEVLKRKIEYCEKREYDENKKKFNKPDSKEFK
ncbi:MAG: MazG nucleotide pyrophosphohydrolase domain-containing protein [Minisyncoccales bacterium]